ncbi:MAG TPA: amidohydrolase family protein [Bryobacteraceae bacterium]|jgi:cytosine/adenosine deaminase-related metal-dependent hydrolase|nr:amidohydrolase family protein [Bryobacteraceae bacterium]
MLIRGARIALSASEAVRKDLWVYGGRVSFLRVPEAEGENLDLEGCMVVPGLINAHDHLELNLLPRLGRGRYKNASEWARDIYHPEEAPIKQHLAVPKPTRLLWGGIKNLLCGVTTVAHHNELDASLFESSFPVRVVRRFGWAHSLAFSDDWKERFRMTPADWPFVMHAAEGTDQSARSELKTLAEAHALNDRTVLVHGVGIRGVDVPIISDAKCSIIWCPTSNAFTLRRSLNTSVLHSGIPIALGSDSAMTAEGDLIDEMQAAHRFVSAKRIYEMVTVVAAKIFRLPHGFGRICEDGPADLLVMKDMGQTPAKTLLNGIPELVMVRGEVKMARGSEQTIEVEGRGCCWLGLDVARLARETKRHLGPELLLAGKRIAA